MPKIILSKELTIKNVKEMFKEAKDFSNKKSRAELDSLLSIIKQIEPREADRMETAYELMITKINELQDEFFERVELLELKK